jgi:hypothetical protein
MIVSVALKCGTPFEDVDMLNMTIKMVNENRRCDCMLALALKKLLHRTCEDK